MLTPEELSAIETRASAASPGIWEFDTSEVGVCYSNAYGIVRNLEYNRAPANINVVMDHAAYLGNETIQTNAEANAEFVAHSHQDIPALLAHIHEQASEIDSLKIELHKAQIDCGLYKTEMFEQVKISGRILELEKCIAELEAELSKHTQAGEINKEVMNNAHK